MDDQVESSNETTDAAEMSSVPADYNFDPAITTSHSYLGDDLEELRGRTLLDNGIYVNLPIVYQKSLILFPEQTLPIFQCSRNIVNMLRGCIDKDRTFGMVHMDTESDYLIGTTAEIYEYSYGQDTGLRIKAKGRQRFKILSCKNTHDQTLADVKILPEIVLGPAFFEERLVSLDRLRVIPKTEEEASTQEHRVLRHDAAVTPWPSWVYRQYDVRRLTMKIHNHLQFVDTRGVVIPEDPVELSFWVARLVMNNAAKVLMLKENCVIYRLQYEAKLLSTLGGKSFICRTCRHVIAKHTDIVPMNKNSLQEAYCNPVGAIHETVTVSKVRNVELNPEPPSTVCSWFPGYAWTIANCAACHIHIGWCFTAVNINLRPLIFWGLTRKNLILKYTVITDGVANSSAVESGGNEQIRYMSGDQDADDDDDDGLNRGIVNYHFRVDM